MCPAANGLGVAQNGFFTDANTDPIPGGRLWPPAAASWNAMRADALADGIKPSEFMPAGPNSSARSRAAQDYFWRNQPPAAARPYTSNHGWGIAVDVATRRAAAWILRNGHRYGWSWDEGRRVGEWWHFRVVRVVKPKPDPLAHLTTEERRWAHEYDALLARKRNRPRRVVLRRVMTARRKAIWRAGEHSGWDRFHRRARYRSLAART